MFRGFTAFVIPLIATFSLAAQTLITDEDDPDPATLERMVKALGSSSFRHREEAMVKLRKLGDLSVPLLERYQNSDDLELRARVRDLLGTIKVTGEVFCYAGHDKGIVGLAMLPGGRRALTAGEDRTIRLLDLEAGGEIHSFQGHTKQVWALAVAPDGKSFV